MDPYHNTFDPQQPAEEDFGEDHLRVLERELAPQATDYYGILNVSKTATEEELKESYKKLCRFFHPDKHNNPESKKLAEAKFQVIQKAYEVLSDPAKRAIYDTYGAEGLNATWEIGTRYKTPEELREEYEKQARIKREQQLENLVRSRAEFQVNLDASPVFDPYEPPIIPAFAARQPPKSARRNIFQPLTRLQVQQLFMRHSFETQVGPQTRVILGGSMLSRNGIGGGNLSGTLRHTVSPKFWTEFTATMLKPHTASLKTYYNISSDTFVNTVSTMRTLERPPVINVTIGRRLYATTTGYMTYRTGEWSLGEWGGDVSRSIDRSAVALGFATARKQGNYSVELQTGIIASHIALEYTHKLLNRILLRLSAVASTTGGLTASVGSDHKITEHSRFGMSIECGVPSGVAVKFKVSRLGQKVVLPIVLSTEFDVKMAFFGAIVPVSIALALDQLILKPRRRKQIKEKIEQLREEHAEYLATRKQEALDGQKLMREVAERKKRQEEKKKDGLVVVKALYGRATDIQQLSGDDDEQLPEGVIDVTVVIQALVNESRVTIPGGYSKTNILGFYDPCLGEKKQLKVRYRFQHRLHEVTVSDTSPLICPMRSHIA